MSNSLLNTVPYVPPPWIGHTISSSAIPHHKVLLGRFPTPIHAFNILDESTNIKLYIKRDDLSSFDLSGNKVRKLEFLLSKALSDGHDSVVTIGGIQSNHARSTAVAARQLGLDPYLILRTREPNNDPGLVGNLLLDRLVGAKIYQVSSGTYAQLGQKKLLNILEKQLLSHGRRPYIIPVGGSDALGAWGYIEAVREIQEQIHTLDLSFDHIVFACGSGGTATGIALACKLSGISKTCQVHAIGVCDSADYFYHHMGETCTALGVDMGALGNPRDWCVIHEGQGLGYARSTDDELEFITKISRKSGIILDPVYSGKALYQLNQIIAQKDSAFKPGQSVLFLHTGGVLGMYDKAEQLLPMLAKYDPVEKLVVDKADLL